MRGTGGTWLVLVTSLLLASQVIGIKNHPNLLKLGEKKEEKKRSSDDEDKPLEPFLTWTNRMDAKFKREYEGRRIVMVCFAQGYPKPDPPSWFKDGKPFTTESNRYGDRPVKFNKKNRVLILDDVNPRDRGDYTCKVSNGNATITWSYKLYVQQNPHPQPPLIISDMSNLTAFEGDNVTLECRVISTLVPHIQWLKHYKVNGSYTGPNDTQYIHRLESNDNPNGDMFLTLYNVTQEDSTRYTCIVYDKEGYGNYIYYFLNVKPAPITTTMQPQVIYVDEGTIHKPMIIIVVGVAGSIAALLIIVICCVYAKRRRPELKTDFDIQNLLANELYRQLPNGDFQIVVDEKWEIERDRITLGDKIGEGAFGRVMKAYIDNFRGVVQPTPVAVKMLKEDAGEQELGDLIKEMHTMENIGNHVNIINFLGCCVKDGPLWVVVELAPYGNLRDFLKHHRVGPARMTSMSDYEKPIMNAGKCKNLTKNDLVSFARQCAKGLQYLATQKIIHRDVAARNVLVAEDYVLKIADYGLARNITEMDYYRKCGDGRLPVKWMAPEALFDRTSTVASDVWSFGILLWEIFSMGGNPYPTVPVEDLFHLLKDGHRMEKPAYSSFEMYTVMLKCWKYNPDERPTFNQLVTHLDNMLSSATKS